MLRNGVPWGSAVAAWRAFLRGQDIAVPLLGNFDAALAQATSVFQTQHGLKPDGIVGGRTYGLALSLGFAGVSTPGDSEPNNVPALTRISRNSRDGLFGKYEWRSAPTDSNPDAIEIVPASRRQVPIWIQENIVVVELPMLVASGLHRTGKIHVHKRAAQSFAALWALWEEQKLLDRLVTFDGCFVTRLTRGHDWLSMHAYAAAFDINARFNRLGCVPALLGEQGCVRELVVSAASVGWIWNGFATNPDGMHLEVTEAGLV
jgi:hypothetical protein